MLITFLAVEQFKMSQNIFYHIFYIILYFTMNPQYICSNGIPTVYHILPSFPNEVFYHEYIHTTLVHHMYSTMNWSLAQTNEHHFLLRCPLVIIFNYQVNIEFTLYTDVHVRDDALTSNIFPEYFSTRVSQT